MTTVRTAPTGAYAWTLGLPTLLGVLIVLLFGGVLSIIGTIDWNQYVRDASVLIGLLGIGHGIDSRSRP